MLDILNRLSAKKFTEVDNFLSFIGIYEDKRREAAFRRLILESRDAICSRIGVEAGAGLGNITQCLLDAGARKVFAVEENEFCAKFLQERFRRNHRVEVVHERIEMFRPTKRIDFLFQELYGPLLLDESILSLERMSFDPGCVIPDGGAILAEAVKLAQFKDPTIDKKIARFLKGALVTDLFGNFKFKNPVVLGEWKFNRGKRSYCFHKAVKKKDEVLILGMEVRHAGKRIIGTRDSFNWPYVFTPVAGERFRIGFRYDRGFTNVDFKWI